MHSSIPTVLLLLVGLGCGACTGPGAQAQRLDRAIRARAHALGLPVARHSTLDAIPSGIRIQLTDRSVELDDLSLWTGLGDEPLAALTADNKAPWTHVPALELRVEGEGSVSPDEPLREAMARARQSAAAVQEATDSPEGHSYTFFAEGESTYRSVVHVLYHAAQSELTDPRLALQGPSGTPGSLPLSTPKLCAATAVHPRSHEGTQCYEPELHVDGDDVIVHGRLASPVTTACKQIMVAGSMPSPGGMANDDSIFEGLAGLSATGTPNTTATENAAAQAPPPRAPCASVQLEAIARDPATLRRAIEDLAGGQEICPQADLSASGTTSWHAVMTAFDVLWSQRHEYIYLSAGVLDPSCESE